jgi:signal peptidase II
VNRKVILLVFVSGAILFFDQLTKNLISRSLKLHESTVVVKGFFSLTYIRNPGAAFGVFADSTDGFRTVFFLVISSLAILLLAYFFLRAPREDSVSLVAIALLFGGALGNLIDRIRFGEVIDFLDFYIGAYHWPAFNVADSAITVGISLLILEAFIKRQIQTDPPSDPFIPERFKGNG